jgi:hypothetical protein
LPRRLLDQADEGLNFRTELNHFGFHVGFGSGNMSETGKESEIAKSQ